MKNRLPDEYLNKSIMADWEEFLNDPEFVSIIEESLNIRSYEKKSHKDSNGKVVNGTQMSALRQALESGKTKRGAIYYLMRAVHFWHMSYLNQVKFNPEEYKNGKVVSSNQHSFIMNQLQLELEELNDIIEGRNIISQTEHSEMKEELNDKIYELEKENKELKSSVEREKQSIEEYYKKKSEGEQRMYEKQLAFYKEEIQKMKLAADRQ